MRIDGTLTKWSDDRGFKFITPTPGGPEVFAHVSAFSLGGQRPRLGERVTFEIGTGKDGKQQAKNIVPHSPDRKPYRLSEPAKRPHKPGLLGRLIPLAFAVALGAGSRKWGQLRHHYGSCWTGAVPPGTRNNALLLKTDRRP